MNAFQSIKITSEGLFITLTGLCARLNNRYNSKRKTVSWPGFTSPQDSYYLICETLLYMI